MRSKVYIVLSIVQPVTLEPDVTKTAQIEASQFDKLIVSTVQFDGQPFQRMYLN